LVASAKGAASEDSKPFGPSVKPQSGDPHDFLTIAFFFADFRRGPDLIHIGRHRRACELAILADA
jgi:hypothetical protein